MSNALCDSRGHVLRLFCFLVTALLTASGVSAPRTAHAALAMDRTKRFSPNFRWTWQDLCVVIANGNVPESVKLAEEYMRRREIPSENYCEVKCSTAEEVSREEFDRDIWKPLMDWALKKEYLVEVKPQEHPWQMNSPYVSGILQFVLTYGMPLRIAEHYEPGESGWHAPSERNAASVDSELATFPLGPGKLAGPIRNPLYRPNEEFPKSLSEPYNDLQSYVCRLDGPTYEIARSLMDRSDNTVKLGLGGAVYIDSLGLKEGARYPVDAMLQTLAKQVEMDGVRVYLDTNPETFPADYPMPHPAAYVGWYAPHVNGPFLDPNFQLWPGAVAYPMHPWGAVSLRTTDRFWAGPLLAKGAGYVIGYVFDPGVDGYVRPDVFLHSMSASDKRAATLVEAAWGASPYLSWSLVVIGEPSFRVFTGTMEMLNRLYKEQPYEGSDITLRAKRRRNIECPADTMPLEQLQEIMDKYNWIHPDFYEFRGDVWAKPDIQSVVASFNNYRQAAALTHDARQRVRVRMAAARMLISLTNPLILAKFQTMSEAFKGGDRFAVARETLEQAIEQDPKLPEAAPAYALLMQLYRDNNQEDKRLDVIKKLAANLPNVPDGRDAAGELWVLDRTQPNPVPTLKVGIAKAAPLVDGDGTDPLWQAAEAAQPKLMKDFGLAAVPSPIELAAAYDADSLYLFVRCAGTPLTEAELLGRPEQPDKEAVEIFLSPKRDYNSAHSLTITRGGGLRALRDDGTTWIFDREKTKIELKSSGEGWSIEIALPLSEFGKLSPKPGDVWGFNFRRQRAIRDQDRIDTLTTPWCGRYGDLSEANQFGYLAFD